MLIALFHPIRSDSEDNAIKTALQDLTTTTVDDTRIREFIAGPELCRTSARAGRYPHLHSHHLAQWRACCKPDPSGEVLARIPMAALMDMMIIVTLSTFGWKSVRDLQEDPASDEAIMAITIALVVSTHDPAQGVIAGVAIVALVFGDGELRPAMHRARSGARGDRFTW